MNEWPFMAGRGMSQNGSDHLRHISWGKDFLEIHHFTQAAVKPLLVLGQADFLGQTMPSVMGAPFKSPPSLSMRVQPPSAQVLSRACRPHCSVIGPLEYKT